MPKELHGNIHISDTSHGRYIDIQIPGKRVHTTLFQEITTGRWFIVSQEFAQKAGLILNNPEIHPIGLLATDNQTNIPAKITAFYTSNAIRSTVEELLNGNISAGDESDLVHLNPSIGLNTLNHSDAIVPERLQQEFSISETR